MRLETYKKAKMKSIFILLLPLLFSCTAVNKLFHKDKHREEKTEEVHAKKDSTATKDSFAVRKSQTDSKDSIVIKWWDGEVVNSNPNIIAEPYKGLPPGIVYLPYSGQPIYFEISKEGAIKTNVVPKSVTVVGKKSDLQIDSLANHSMITLDDVKDESSHVKTLDKTVEKEVHKKQNKLFAVFIWCWIILFVILIGYLIYRNWPKIKAIVIHLMTGL